MLINCIAHHMFAWKNPQNWSGKINNEANKNNKVKIKTWKKKTIANYLHTLTHIHILMDISSTVHESLIYINRNKIPMYLNKRINEKIQKVN